MNFFDIPTALFCRVGQHLSSNQERANLAVTCRAGREMMGDYPWGPSEYDGLVPHRQAPQDSQGWLELNRERAKLRAKPAAQLLNSCRGYLKKGKPEKVLALLAPNTPELHLYHDVMRKALQMQGRDAQRCALDDHMCVRQDLKRALVDGDIGQVKGAIERGAALDRSIMTSMPGITNTVFWQGVCPVLHQMGQRDSLEAIAKCALSRGARMQAFSYLAPASPAVLETMMRRGGHAEEVQAIFEHAIDFHLHDWQARLLVFAVAPPNRPRCRSTYPSVVAGAMPSAEGIMQAEYLADGGNLFSTVRANLRLSDDEKDDMLCALVGIYARAGLMPVEDVYQANSAVWQQVPPGSNILKKTTGPRQARLSLRDVSLWASPRVLRALREIGFTLSTKEALRDLYVPLGSWSEHGVHRMKELRRNGVWIKPSKSQFASAVALAGEFRDSLLSLAI